MSARLTLDRLANWLTLGVVVIAFLLSFGALRDLAADVGIVYPALYPIMIDAGLVIYNIMALQSSLNGERNRYAWALIICATLASVCLNVVHALEDLPPWLAPNLGPAMAAVPPLVIFGAFHLVVLRIEQQAKQQPMAEQPDSQPNETRTEQPNALQPERPERSDNTLAEHPNNNGSERAQPPTRTPDPNAVSFNPNSQPNGAEHQAQQAPVRMPGPEQGTIEQTEQQPLPERISSEQTLKPNGQPTPTVAEQTHIEPKPNNANGRVFDLDTRTLSEPNTQAFEPNSAQPNDTQPEYPNSKQTAVDSLLVYVAEYPNATLADIGQHIGRSKSTVSTYLADLTAAGHLSKNEQQGWQVTQKEK